jgi:hypothetical protein
MVCPFMTTMKLLTAMILVIYSFFQIMAWRNRAKGGKQPAKQEESKPLAPEEATTDDIKPENKEETVSE